jgi:aspartate aminotransferase
MVGMTAAGRTRAEYGSAVLDLSTGLSRLGTETAFDVLARARALERAGRDVIHLEIGEPDFPTPEHVAEAGIAAIRAGHTHYCPTAGLVELREAAAAYL